MRYARLLAIHWPLVCMTGAALGALALLELVRDGPVQVGLLGRIDGLGAFFACASFGGLALAGLARPAALRSWRVAASGLALAVAYTTPFMLVLAGSYAALALLVLVARRRWAGASAVARAAPLLLAAPSLLIGYGALALRGSPRYDDPAAAAALDSFALWFVLLAATLPILDFGSRMLDRGDADPTQFQVSALQQFDVLRIAWLYPLARLYSLGQWNPGWSLAAVLFGGAVAAWSAISALTEPRPAARRARASSSMAGLALAGVGLGTSAGMVASSFAVLASLLVAAVINSPPEKETRRQGNGSPESALSVSQPPDLLVSAAGWALTTAFPFTAPFVAAWMLIGAGLAGGVALLAGLAWLVALALGLAAALWGPPGAGAPGRVLLGLAALSVSLGVGAPLAVPWLIRPAVEQLQGGLTPYGEVNVWPWVGLAASDAAHTQVTALPSIAVALLMLVLCALVYVVARLRASGGTSAPDALDPAAESADRDWLLRSLRAEVPWLALLLGADRSAERPRGDRE